MAKGKYQRWLGPDGLLLLEGWAWARRLACQIRTLREIVGFDYTSRRWEHKRAAILRRDGYRCAWCRRYGRSRQAVVVHHVNPVEEFPELAYEDSNLVSLCQGCHNKAHPEKARAATAGRLR